MIFLKQILSEMMGMGLNQKFWLRKDGKGVRVPHHDAHARQLAGLDGLPTWKKDEAYKWMFDRGWARICVENNDMYIDMAMGDDARVNLTKAQKDWIEDIIALHPVPPMQIMNKFGRHIEL